MGLETGGTSDLVLHGVVDVLLLADGVLLIAEQSTQQVVQVRLTSGGLRRHGRKGDGPLEFQALSSLHDLGDGRFGAWDSQRQRIVEFDTTGRGLEGTSFAHLTGSYSAGLHTTAAQVRYVTVGGAMPDAPTGSPIRDRIHLLRSSAAISSLDTVAVLPGASIVMTPQMVGRVLFGPLGLTAGAPNGVWLGDTDRPEVNLLSEIGEVAAVVRWRSAVPRALTQARKDAFWRLLAEGLPHEQASMLDEMRSVMVFADSVPSFGSIVSSDDGSIWIGGYSAPEYEMLQLPGPPITWLVVHPASGRVGRAQTPSGLQPLRIGDNYLLGVHVDDLGRETVRLHRYQWRVSSSAGRPYD